MLHKINCSCIQKFSSLGYSNYPYFSVTNPQVDIKIKTKFKPHKWASDSLHKQLYINVKLTGKLSHSYLLSQVCLFIVAMMVEAIGLQKC